MKENWSEWYPNDLPSGANQVSKSISLSGLTPNVKNYLKICDLEMSLENHGIHDS